MKCKGERMIKEVPLINLLKPEDLENLNKRFGTYYKPHRESTARIIEEVRLEELARLMRQKPERGGYGI